MSHSNANNAQPYSSPPKISQRGQGKPQTRFEKETAANGGKVDTFGDPPTLGPWVLGDTIGKGSSGRVRLARHCQSGKLAAVKIIPKNIMFSSRMSISNAGAKHEKLLMSIQREIVIMKLIDHPNIMALYDVFEADNELFLLLEYIEGGELFDFLVSKGRLQPSEALRYFREIIQGVDYCHRFNICHRDLKPENLLLDKNKNIKIADFGMAALEISNGMLETSCGSPHYASPEIVAGKAYHGAASDIWSCGVVLFALLVGRLPFDDQNMRVLLQKVRVGKFDMPAFIPTDAKDLIRKMLVVDPEQRIQMAEIISHPFFTTASVPRTSIGPIAPSLEEFARNAPSEKSIDKQALGNLSILWPGHSESRIKEALLSPQANAEKAYYFLLVKYMQKVLEEYDENTYSFGFQSGRYQAPEYLIKHQIARGQRDKDEEIARRQAREKEREREREGGATRGRRVRDSVTVATNTNGVMRGSADTRAPFPTSPGRGTPDTIVATRDAPSNPSPTKRTNRINDSVAPPPRRRPASVMTGPRPPVLHTKSAGLAFSSPRAKYTSDGGTSGSEVEDRRRMPPPPSPQARRSYHSDAGSNPLSGSPDVGAQNSSSATARAIESNSSEIVRARFGFGNPEREEAFAQSMSKTTSTEEATLPLKISNTPRGLGLSISPPVSTPADDGEPTSASMSPQSSRKSSKSSGRVQNRSTVAAPAISPPLVQDPALQRFFIEVAGALNNLNATEPPLLGTPVSLPQTPSMVASPQQQPHHSRSMSNKERDGAVLTTPGGSKTPVKAHTVDGFVNVTMQDATPVKLMFAAGASPATSGKKGRPTPLDMSTVSYRASTFGAPSPSPMPSPLLSGTELGRHGQGWFTSLFNFKPASFTLYSGESVVVTRRECASLLESFGVSVTLEENGDVHGVLKCFAEKIHDPAGNFHNKSVRFRVQFCVVGAGGGLSSPGRATLSAPGTPFLYSPTPSPLLSPAAAAANSIGFGCVITLIQERGARSSLEAVAQKLRHEWNLDTLSSAQPSPMLEGGAQFAS
ncbi:hypothetical protein FRB96_008983 [Tulasnella sp. 330]|nr:hypothetical protein FRB96_008983 [Tulasnella sp. 330]KAG8883645.1 hypothetical protein FRB97_006134 [Tulasnella sp. 331]KAG8889094.1 hypothetical protein FRB98_005844 [Tulasnella sp. 332]